MVHGFKIANFKFFKLWLKGKLGLFVVPPAARWCWRVTRAFHFAVIAAERLIWGSGRAAVMLFPVRSPIRSNWRTFEKDRRGIQKTPRIFRHENIRQGPAGSRSKVQGIVAGGDLLWHRTSTSWSWNLCFGGHSFAVVGGCSCDRFPLA